MTRPRDSQRSRVYAGERHWPGFLMPVGTGSVRDCQAFVDGITRSAWWRNRGGRAFVEVRDGRGRSNAASYGGYVKVPRWGRTRGVLLHELAHELTPHGVAGHGPEYAANYVALVRNVEGPEAGAALKEGLREARVRIRGGNVVKVRPVPKRRCSGCGQMVSVHATWWGVAGWEFHTKACATRWFTRELRKGDIR